MGRSTGGGDTPTKRERSSQAGNVPMPAAVRIEDRFDAASLRIDPSQLFFEASEQTRMALCISDPHQDDTPIVYCNQAFCDLTGYERREILGRNCRFLQGAETDPAAVATLREAVVEEAYRVTDILNYRKDGTKFWNAVHVGPVYDRDGALQYFYGSQWDITDLVSERENAARQERIAHELRHRTENLFAALTAIVRLSARDATSVESVTEKISQRIDALSAAHRASLSPEGMQKEETDLKHLVQEVMKPYQTDRLDRISTSGQFVSLPRRMVTPVGLTLHELATNALKYGALSVPEGEVSIAWTKQDDELKLHWEERNGPPVENGAGSDSPKGSGTGSRLIDGVLGGIGGSIDTRYEPEGLSADITVKVE
ncbi:PAS domain-containing protein [Qipengyuania sp. JC766]|uniref:PAS domain-containing protein n=1 Tax=Qipengyuania sp. JC766 TaxID=3232139 RepID=UPI0034585A1F